ncbi:MAG: hypothetical protein U0822_16625 [Anaerolineae bacterium]
MRNRWLLVLLAAAGALAAIGIISPGAPFSPPPPQAAAAPAAPLRFVDDGDNALASVPVRILCYTETLTGYRLTADIPTSTDADGHPQNLPIPCDALAALYKLDSRDSNKPGHGAAYDVYATSWTPGDSTPTPANGDIKISDKHPLVLFHLVVSLEWQPSSSDYLDDMHAALRAASSYLYTASAGQLAFGKVEIHTNAEAWDGADMRVLAANDFTPAAYVGGIVPKMTTYTSPKGVRTLYAPAEIFLGRSWDGERAWDMDGGRWSYPDGYRTLIHEWSHYALFLYDEYRQAGGAATYCTCTDLPLVGATPGPGTPTPPTVCSGVSPSEASSLMAFQYIAGEYWHPLQNGSVGGTPVPPAACVNTDQDQVNGEADWSTLEHWSATQGLSPEWLRAPGSLAPVSTSSIVDALFDTEPAFRVALPLLSLAPPDLRASARRPSAPHATRAADPTVNLRLPSGSSAASIGLAQVYVVPAPDSPAIVYQGQPHGPGGDPTNLGDITLLGVGEKSQAYVYADEYFSGGSGTVARHYVYPAPGDSSDPLTDGAVLKLADSPWRPTLNVTFDLDGPQVRRMNISLDAGVSLPSAPDITLVAPDAAPMCGDCRQTMSGAGAAWTASYSVPAGVSLPRHGVLRIDAGSAGTLMRWYQAAGGVGPAHMPGFAPLDDSLATVSAPLNAFENASAVFYMPATNDRLFDQLPSGVGGTLGLPLDVKVAFQDRRPPENGNMPLPAGTTLSLAYDPQLLARLGFSATQLRIAHLVRSGSGGQWQVTERGVNPKGADFRGWVTTPVSEDGIYAIVLPPAFNVVSAKVFVDPSNSQVCPTTFTAIGTISTNGAGVVRYQWERSDGGVGPVEQITFSSAGSQTVQDTWELSAEGDYWMRLHILAPNDLVSDEGTFRLTCATGQVTSVTASVNPTFSLRCPTTFTFTGTIETDGPVTVRYEWDRSTNVNPRAQTLRFTGAGTQTVRDTWTVGQTMAGGASLRILDPNIQASRPATFQAVCLGQ